MGSSNIIIKNTENWIKSTRKNLIKVMGYINYTALKKFNNMYSHNLKKSFKIFE